MRIKTLHILAFILIALSNQLINAQNTELLDSVEHVVFLIGDAGEPENKTSKVFDSFLRQAKPIENNSTVIFLGDNIYPGGMPNQTEEGRKEAEDIILYQLNRLKKIKTKTYYIPGNHDWNKGKEDGLAHLLNEEIIIEKTLGTGNSFIPSNGCSGPFKINLSDHLILIALDTQWWLHKYERGSCDSISTKDIINNLKEILANNKDKNILITGHHPIISKGDHGGYFTLKNHIFPLTNLNKNLFIPLPIIGSILPLYRKFIGNKQDIANRTYKKFIKQIESAFDEHNNLIYAAGHEHNLQYYDKENRHYIISGSGGKTSDVKNLKLPNFSSDNKGFFKLSYMRDGRILIETYGIIDGTEKLLFQKMIPRFEKR